MSVMNSILSTLAERFALGPNQVEKRNRARRKLEQILNANDYLNYGRPIRTFVQGSTAHDTSIHVTANTTFDVDIVAVYESRLVDPVGKLDSRKHLIAMRDLLKANSQNANLDKDRCIRIHRDPRFLIDVVAAFTTHKEGVLWVPDIEGIWVRNAPELHNIWCQNLDEKSFGIFSKCVRLIKLWKQATFARGDQPPTSFEIELMVGFSFDLQPPLTLVQALISVFSNLEQDKLSSIFTNPNLPSENLFSGWRSDDLPAFMTAVGVANEQLAYLESVKESDWRESINVLKNLFGNELVEKVLKKN